MFNRDDRHIGGGWLHAAGDATIPLGNPAAEEAIFPAPAGCASDVDRPVRSSARVRAGEPVLVAGLGGAGLSAVLGARQVEGGGVPDAFERMRAGLGVRSVLEFDT
ncbi:D-arabinose 1-dehydrogenase-like Zn-dependent alcohol dehydrogenase [Lipingzhangella halophila]|uniref:D-arabinose 1-dehydrogenase-like Zn-dependent alcohol dehydrogenase n=1 Tax=Lipingzhangella halophila TaxID=1783352 RepID=A0A7W7REF6_9ACTN|nr:hypothetical protein [Lipingzhangella halophila]MBB4930487.1 D-arabinose 1-dehydrogenase-like Zn-dependent alcohol dehydrogenase [Lipingzhangella halophila]